MKISTNGLALVKAFEGCHRSIGGGKFRAYADPIGVLTIGWGHTNHHGRSFDASTVWTQGECDAELASDMGRFEKAVDRLVTVDLAQHQFDALVSFAYNCGDGNLQKSTLLRRVNAQDWLSAAAEFAKWNKAGGSVLPGLTRRRKAEGLLFAGKIVEALQVAGAKAPPTKPVIKPADPVKIPPPPDVPPVEPKPAPKPVGSRVGTVVVTTAGAAIAHQTGVPPWAIAAVIAAVVVGFIAFKILRKK